MWNDCDGKRYVGMKKTFADVCRERAETLRDPYFHECCRDYTKELAMRLKRASEIFRNLQKHYDYIPGEEIRWRKIAEEMEAIPGEK